MQKKCKKCGYTRKDKETVPDYECPKCGIIYAKYEKRLENHVSNGQAEAVVNDPAKASKNNDNSGDNSTDHLEPVTADLKQRGLAGIASFSLFAFVNYLIRLPFGLMILTNTNRISTAHAQQVEDFLKVSILLISLLICFVVLPLFWQGRTYGQKIMGINVTSKKNISSLKALIAILTIRACFRPLAFVPWFINGTLTLKDFGDGLTGCRQVSEKDVPQKAWFKAFKPLLYLLILMFIWIQLIKILSPPYKKHQTQSHEPKTTKQIKPSLNYTMKNSMRLLPAAVTQYMNETGMDHVSDKDLDRILTGLIPLDELLYARHKGLLKLVPQNGGFEIGLRVNDEWYIINQDSSVRVADSFG